MRMARSAVRQSIRDDVVSLLTTKGRMPLPVPQLMDVQGGQGKARMAVCATWTAGGSSHPHHLIMLAERPAFHQSTGPQTDVTMGLALFSYGLKGTPF